jgi:methylenetetrahydrofolate dehydrogenase (NADP+)/methenyltetrahydrofolate cyclohydrolase
VSTAVDLGGRELAASIRAGTAESVAGLTTRPHLAVVSATADEASAWYVRSLSTLPTSVPRPPAN